MQKISTIIITKNEASNIKSCIESCLSISDEIIVVDSHSSDNTVEIAASLGAIVYTKAWEGYGSAKNFGALKARNEWILSIDADERLDGLAQETIKSLSIDNTQTFALKRINFIGSQSVKYGEWNPDVKNRIYNKLQCQWSLDAVHESLILPINMKTHIIKGSLLHYSYTDIDDLAKRLDTYAQLAAKDLCEKKQPVHRLAIVVKPIARFVKSYLLKLGFLDGKTGWKIALLNARAVKKRYMYLKEMLKT